MTEIKDPAIKLFGKTIPLPESQIPSEAEDKSDQESQISPDSDDMDECGETTKMEAGDLSNKSSTLNEANEDIHQTASPENKAKVDPKPDEDEAETDMVGEEKVLKKPDKILPCPRCNSLDTKFCYYNNYNVNQPRHFCKNCQRYWTAGGTMRNVPVGAGRRKNKHSSSQYRHMMVSSDGIPTTRIETSDSSNHQVLSCGRLSNPTKSMKENGTVLKFGPDVPLCESMATVLNLGEQKRNDERGSVASGKYGEPFSGGSSMTASTCREKELPENVSQTEHGGTLSCSNKVTLAHPLQCYTGPPWTYTWNPGWNNMAAMAVSRCSSELVYGLDSGNPNSVQWVSPPMLAAPGFCTPSIPLPFVPASYLGSVPNWPAVWNGPWVGSNGNLSPPSSNGNSVCSDGGSPTLGKHSRDANSQGEEKPEKCLWIPKTLRIDDPDEAAKSSIWATLGIKPGQREPMKNGGIFEALQHKTEGKVHITEAAHVLRANPAAFSRSQTFQEST